MYQPNYQQPYANPYGNAYGLPTYGQNSYPSPQNMMRQPQPQSQPTMQYELPIQDIRFVTSEEAKAYIVMPNTKALLIDRNGVAYLKTADGMGQSQTQYFRFEPINADGSPIKPQEQPQSVDLTDYIKKEDLQSMGFVTKDQFNTLCQKIEQLQKQLNPPNKPNNR